MGERLTWEEIKKKYPKQWVGIVEPEFSNPATIISGIVKYTEKDMSLEDMVILTTQGKLFARNTNTNPGNSVGALMA